MCCDKFLNYIISFFAGLVAGLTVTFSLGELENLNHLNFMISIVFLFFFGWFCIFVLTKIVEKGRSISKTSNADKIKRNTPGLKLIYNLGIAVLGGTISGFILVDNPTHFQTTGYYLLIFFAAVLIIVPGLLLILAGKHELL